MLVLPPFEEYIGNHLYLLPGYGWGWRRADTEAPIDYAPIARAGGCLIRVHSFFSWRGVVRGFTGRIEQPGHLLDTLYIVCGEMLAGTHDFTTNLCFRYDLEIGPQPPTAEEWPRITAGEPSYSGYGIVAVSEEAIQTFKQRDDTV